MAEGKRASRNKSYLPQKNSVAYALLITLYRADSGGKGFLHKQELINGAEASGLSRVPIAPESGKGKPSRFGVSTRNWYSGWNCMKTLIAKGLVAKSSCPAKYMLTDEGKQVALECLSRSSTNQEICLLNAEQSTDTIIFDESDLASDQADAVQDMTFSSDFDRQNISDNPTDAQFDDRESHGKELMNKNRCREQFGFSVPFLSSFGPRSCSFDFPAKEAHFNSCKSNLDVLKLPPLSYMETFDDIYEIILLLDDREQYAMQGSKGRKLLDSICKEYKLKVQVRRLPIGDGLWIARNKIHGTEYVLDFIVERKKIDDLHSSIKDNRYRDQKLRLLDCGLRKLIYLVEGDPNASDAAESIKTACYTTEVLDGFDVQRTSGLADTLRKYVFLTQAITKYCQLEMPSAAKNSLRDTCPLFDEFIERCVGIEKMTVSELFAVQLMQVPQVTEDVAVAVLKLYPTPLSLAHAYSLLEGDAVEQEQMLVKQTSSTISARASKNIYNFIWCNDN